MFAVLAGATDVDADANVYVGVGDDVALVA